jgi:citrate synthase
MTDYLSAAEAAKRLGVSRQTLYAYVSRGLLRAHEASDPRQRRYASEAIARLVEVRSRGRRPKEVAKATLDYGLPVLESAITLIRDGCLSWRGADAVALAKHASLEEVAALLWRLPAEDAFGPTPPTMPDIMPALTRHYAGTPRDEALLPLFAAATGDDATATWQQDPRRLAEGCGALVRVLLACAADAPTDAHAGAPAEAPDGTPADTPDGVPAEAPDGAPADTPDGVPAGAPADAHVDPPANGHAGAAPVHRQLAAAWRLDAQGTDLVRMALVLCADHELNASGFTARCVASTGASLRAAVIGGLAALSGGRHGGTTARIEALWRSLDDGDLTVQLRRWLAMDAALPGFGHPLYPDGDVRAAALLEPILPRFPRARELVAAVAALTGQAPNIDFALVAVRRFLALPEGSAFGLFAVGRSVGWIAHALEQRGTGQLIRPRAVYVGPMPGDETQSC